MPLGSPLGANMAPFWLPKSSQILPKIDPKMHQIFDRFWHRFFIDFWSFLEANLEPCWPLFRSKHGNRERAVGGLCWVYLLFRFLGRPGPLLAPCGLDLRGFGAPCWRFVLRFCVDLASQLGAMMATFSFKMSGRCGTPAWSLKGWWGYAKRKECKLIIVKPSIFPQALLYNTFAMSKSSRTWERNPII